MTPYSGLLFFYSLVLLLLPAVLIGLLGRPLRYYGYAFSIIMLCIVFGEGGQLPALFLFWFWQTVVFLVFRPAVKKRLLLWMAVVFAILPLALVKVGEVWSVFALFRLLGVSSMTFRAVEVFLNLHDGATSCCFSPR